MVSGAAAALRPSRREVSRIVRRGLGLALLMWLLPLLLHLSLSIVVPLVAGLAASVVMHLVGRLQPAAAPPESGAARASEPAPDRPFAGVEGWVDRLSWGLQDRRRFESGVRPGLVRLADQLLLDRHSVTRASHPERARKLLGPRLWDLATQPAPPGDRARTVTMTLDQLVADLEGL